MVTQNNFVILCHCQQDTNRMTIVIACHYNRSRLYQFLSLPFSPSSTWRRVLMTSMGKVTDAAMVPAIAPETNVAPNYHKFMIVDQLITNSETDRSHLCNCN